LDESMTTQEFEIVPAGKLATLFPLLIGLILPMVILTAMVATAKESNEWQRAAPAMLILPAVAALLAWSMYRRKVLLSDKWLIVRRLPWPRAIKLSLLSLDEATIVNLEDHPELKPAFKVAGVGLPGYRSGLFRLRDRRRATVLLTEYRRVLVLPTHDGGVVLLSPQRPEALLEALRSAAK
jgi:hypothetical protein